MLSSKTSFRPFGGNNSTTVQRYHQSGTQKSVQTWNFTTPKYGTCSASNVWPRCCQCHPYPQEKKKMGYRVEDLIAPDESISKSCDIHQYYPDRYRIPSPYPVSFEVGPAPTPPTSISTTRVVPRVVATRVIIPSPQTATSTTVTPLLWSDRASTNQPCQSSSPIFVASDTGRQQLPSQPLICGTIDYQQLAVSPVINRGIVGTGDGFTQLQGYPSLPSSAAVRLSTNANPPSPASYKKRIRVKFTSKQLKMMNEKFKKMMYIDKKERLELSKELNVTETQIKNFWQNKRMKVKQQKMLIKKENPDET